MVKYVNRMLLCLSLIQRIS